MNNQKILHELKQHLKKHYGNAISEVVLFGSRIYGDTEKHSHYDIIIILDKNYSAEDENRILDLCYEIDLKYDIVLDVHLLSKNELISVRGQQPIFTKALKFGMYA